jgi:EAL domain-containing protein (putative c-di-GMP-specific phosphodiesterase class I)
VTLYPQDDGDPDALLRHADQAMYRAKAQGRNQFSLFDIAIEAKVNQQRERLKEIANGLAQGEFQLYYQPKVELQKGTVAGFEGLIRWQHPRSGLLSPLTFLPALENTDLECRFGDYVIGRALAQLERWASEGYQPVVSVNISGRHLLSADFTLALRAQLRARPRVQPEQLELEILESAAVTDLDTAISVLHEVRTLGLKVSLDDFGTGYSSLSHLRSLPVDEVKIDQSFVRDMLSDINDYNIVRSVIGLAAAFDLCVVAEGVETTEQADALRKLGCQLGQGYVFAKPMPAAQVTGWLAAQNSP